MFVSLERDFIAEYSAMNRIKLLPVSRKTHLLKPGTFRMIQVVDGSERSDFCLLQGLNRSPDFKPPKIPTSFGIPPAPQKKNPANFIIPKKIPGL